MGVLENIGAFAQGATQGTQQGMNLYQQFGQIQDQQKKRKLQADREAFVAQKTQEGGFSPEKRIDTLKEIADFTFGQGDLETGQQLYEFSTKLQKSRGDQSLMYAGSIGKFDPVKAMDYYNKGLADYGIADRLKVSRLPTGGLSVTGTIGGANFNQPMTEQEYHDFLQDGAARLMMGPEDYGKLELEKEKTRAAVAESESTQKYNLGRLSLAQEEQPAQLAALQAQTESSLASAAENRAQAADYAQRRPIELARAQSEAATSELDRRIKEHELGEARAGRGGKEKMEDVLNIISPEIDPLTDPRVLEAETEEEKQAIIGRNQAERGAMGAMVQQLGRANNMDPYSAALLAKRFAAGELADYDETAPDTFTHPGTGDVVKIPSNVIGIVNSLNAAP